MYNPSLRHTSHQTQPLCHVDLYTQHIAYGVWCSTHTLPVGETLEKSRLQHSSPPLPAIHNEEERITSVIRSSLLLCWRLPIFPGRFQPSIVGADELNCRVRDGNGWTLTAIGTNSPGLLKP